MFALGSMGAGMRGWLRWAHGIVGLTAGIVLALMGVTGALLAFEQEIVDLLNANGVRITFESVLVQAGSAATGRAHVAHLRAAT